MLDKWGGAKGGNCMKDFTDTAVHGMELGGGHGYNPLIMATKKLCVSISVFIG